MTIATNRGDKTRRGLALLATALAVTGVLITAGPSGAEGGLCSFTLSGSLAWVWYPGPWPPPAAVIRVEFWDDDEPISYLVYCWGELAPVCAQLEIGTPLLVMGEDDGEQKHATHIGVWLVAPVAGDAED